jgi:hypothetical protein
MFAKQWFGSKKILQKGSERKTFNQLIGIGQDQQNAFTHSHSYGLTN